MASSELNTVLRRNASNAQARQQARQVVQKGAATLSRRVPNKTRERLVPPLAGLCSAAIEITALWPLEFAKTQQQLSKDFRLGAFVKQNGAAAVYGALPPMLIGAPLQGLLRFTSLDFANKRLADPATGRISVASGLLAGLGAGVLESCLVVTPMETVKTRLIHSKKGLLDGVKHIVASHGVGGLYKGLGATIAKSASNQGLRFIIFNQYKNVMLENPTEQKLTAGQALVGGMAAGFFGCFGNTPIDTIKSRMQSMDAARYKSVWHCGKTIVQEEGALALYKGLVPRLGRVLPGQGIIFCSYEVISSFLKDQMLL